MSVGDDMQIALEAEYGTEFIGDGYALWVAEYGPSWEDLVGVVEAATSLTFADGWSLYWETGLGGGAPATFRILLENGDVLVTESGDPLRTE